MKKKSGKTLMQKWKNKIGGKLSALNKKELVLTNIPYALAAFYADRAFFLYRNSPGEDMGNKLLYAMEHADRIFAGFVLSNNWKDLLAGIVVAVVLKVLVWQKQADAKKLRKGIEYGSARWGTAEDIKPYMSEDPWMNIPLTATEALTMESRPKQPKYARNKNIVVIGGSGSGKTRFFVKPSVMQMNCSMVITDPKGTLIEECGKMLAKGPPKKDKNGNIMKDKSGKVVHEPYVIKVLNTINFSKSLHYNPFAYIRSEKDILKLVTTIIVNTKGEGEKASEDFWVKAEKLLYTALIAFIWYEGKEEEKNLNTLLDLLNESETREEDETYQNPVDMLFEELEAKEPQHFAVRQYKKYKMAAGKTAKSILISCGARLAPFDIAELREIMSYDEMELDKIGDRKTALFLIMSDTDTTFNFVIAMLQSQLFNLLCDKADDVYGGRLPVHVRVIADEFANIGQIPQFDKLIATIRSREISASIILQSQSQLKAMYKDSADTILGNCDTTLFLGGKEKTTLKEMSELLGKETIDLYNTSETRSNQKSFGLNYQKTGKQLMTEDEIAVMDGGKCILQIRGARPFFSDKYDITKHKNYRFLADENEKNRYKVEKELNPQYTPKPEEEVEVIQVELSE
ncbi:type IV secretory system conjugative DNA transfer family protein [[Clostridium] scindens]|nr:type IV secretory system conjugative DNA transfer family protein [[Clostridium] scindens]MCB6286930.1 type IV secretory system conjugative DNA transfer family protein [[Clostridium] scindens]MCB7193364.1 type IV secretory system conjugative DNA transfer family protein [[Clostridium] scindens]MCB7286527.1 type IV secretory system conjugative DNA transfer family protein [[Clostridium] scindens]MCQ5288340.1 type IV secretory system conjugative DNA transfer family protein [[Clostridium] scindens